MRMSDWVAKPCKTSEARKFGPRMDKLLKLVQCLNIEVYLCAEFKNKLHSVKGLIRSILQMLSNCRLDSFVLFDWNREA